ncbi:uncharacterized protein LOC123561149 [Mercenaria mercenaria]|uniref:uncharacterized protein LOC123561149 n=1 Tax=Mercenaria mercenaria TaxID=6596 RepID=UPI00234F27A8|nr:uncharacterized protein LOC123561149 [Mercenaria mercenaria]
MATADNTRHLRYLLLFGEGGILILRAVLERGITNSGKTLDELLQTNKRHFNRVDKKQSEKLFPPNGIVDRDTWDISLLCTVILQLFGNSLTSDERGGIRTLRDLRNHLAHSASFSRDEEAYNDERRDVESILITLSNGLDRSVHDACQDLIQRCVTGPLDMQADTERVKELSRYDEKFSEQFRILTERVEGIAERVENVEEKVEFIAERVKEQEDLTFFLRNMVRENADFHVFQVLRTVLTLRGPNARLTSLGNKAILTVFTTALKRTGDGENLSELETEVMNILDEIERCNGVKVGEAESKCVKISMQCRTCSGLLELLEYLQGDAFRKRLLNLILAVEEMFKGVFNVTFEIERESLKEILHSLQNSTLSRREVIGADDNLDGQSGATVQETARLKPDQWIRIYSRSTFYAVILVLILAYCTKSIALVPTDVETEFKKENEALLDEIIEACECIDDEDANHVILLIGSIGVGKSSFINTLHKVLTGKYFIIAKQGRGVTQSVTGELLRYNNCGSSKETIKRIPDVHRRQKLTQIYKKLPQIIDFAGLGNVNTPELSEILELLIGDQCEIFVLITKYDLVNESRDPSLDGRVISVDEFKKSETAIAEAFCNVGAVGCSTLRWVNFTDNIGFSESKIRNKALNCLKKIIEPGVPKMPEPTFSERLEEYLYQTFHKLRRACIKHLRERHISCLSIIGGLVLALVFIYGMLCLLRASV